MRPTGRPPSGRTLSARSWTDSSHCCYTFGSGVFTGDDCIEMHCMRNLMAMRARHARFNHPASHTRPPHPSKQVQAAQSRRIGTARTASFTTSGCSVRGSARRRERRGARAAATSWHCLHRPRCRVSEQQCCRSLSSLISAHSYLISKISVL